MLVHTDRQTDKIVGPSIEFFQALLLNRKLTLTQRMTPMKRKTFLLGS